ncbi:SDR family oxidoreductase [Paenarthrobacter ureafaciens]|uniref:SDR family oxidoreductase n=1 Tax=Paenarthrobacter TaxID=1742992 RepID=UPI00397D7777
MPGNSNECRVDSSLPLPPAPGVPLQPAHEQPLEKQPDPQPSRKTVLVTGATGYIGGRLVPRLLEAGHRVKVLVRSPQKIADVPWHGDVEIIQDSLDNQDTAARAMEGVDVLYYLVHSMASGGGYEAKEEAMARLVAAAASAAKVSRIVYLGGLHPDNALLSTHMRSREKVGRVFLESGVDSIVFQAGVVIGSGSASFEMIRHLADTLPVMPAPSWVNNRIEAIAVRDVLHYLVAAATLPDKLNRTFDIGSRDVLKYKDMMNQYAVERGLPRRLVIALPVPAPKLAGLWVALVTPIPLSMSFPLVQSLQHDAVSREHDVDRYIPLPDGGLTPYRRAVALALGKERDGQVETTWANAGVDSDPLPSDPDWAGYKVYVDERKFHSPARPEHVWTIIEGIGGKNGWYSLPLAWRIRGWMDKLQGGAGLLRGRRHPKTLNSGEVVDWWRVEAIDRGHLLRLRAEMRAPGRAWLELAVEPDGDGSLYRQRAIFFPRGLAGRLYWLGVYPFHGVIFPSMARNISAAATALQEASREQGAAGAGSGAASDTP